MRKGAMNMNFDKNMNFENSCNNTCETVEVPEYRHNDNNMVNCITQEFDCGAEQEVIQHQHVVKHRRDIINEYNVVHQYDINHYDVVRHRDVVRHNDFTNHRPNYCGNSCNCGCCDNCVVGQRPTQRRHMHHGHRHMRPRRRFW